MHNNINMNVKKMYHGIAGNQTSLSNIYVSIFFYTDI